MIGSLVLAAPRRSRFADLGLVGIVAVYTCVIGWNIAMLLQASDALRSPPDIGRDI